MKPIKIILIFIGLIYIFSIFEGCDSNNKISAYEVLNQYLQAYQHNNFNKMKSLLSENWKDINFVWQKSEPFTVSEISEDNLVTENYLKYGRGRINKPYDAISYKIKLQKRDNKNETQITIKIITLIKSTQSSPWKIDDWGSG